MNYQVTLLCKSGEYKPISCIVKSNTPIDLNNAADKRTILNRGIVKMCSKRGWTQKDLQRYSYTSAKVREYDEKRIKAENAIKYAQIKRKKYASGEWIAPKNK